MNHHRRKCNIAIQRESDRLRPLFLRFCGRRHIRTVAATIGIDPRRAGAWVSGHNLAPDAQAVVRAALGDQGGAP